MMTTTRRFLLLASMTALAACGSREPPEVARTLPAAPEGTEFLIATAPRAALLEAAGTARPYAEATLSTKLMGSVIEVTVREGDHVRRGQPLVRIDARDLEAKEAQVAAGLGEAEANYQLAQTHEARMRALFDEEAAPRAQLDAARTALTSAAARVASARAAAAELSAVGEYAVVRAPFDGIVIRRLVDPGSFAAPGTPLITVQDAARLRVSVSAAPATVRALTRGDSIRAIIEGVATMARVEGIVPAAGGNLHTINATVENRDHRFLSGSAATLAIPQGTRPSIVIPASAIVRQGDLTGVHVYTETGAALRWIRLGTAVADSVEVLSGLRAGERIVVLTEPAQGR
jgi:RND family efflux transporter MFP subunit